MQSFALEAIRPVRSTRFVSIRYSGRDCGSAECVASNAAILALRFYATNQPSWEVSYLDTFPFKRDSLPERARDFVWSYVIQTFSK